MTYSCPIWLPTSHAGSLTETLEAAQQRKLRRFIENTRIQPSDHVLEIGTGWGSFAIAAVRMTGCRVTSLTLSVEQKELAEQRIQEAGLQDKIQVLLCDYRDAPLQDGSKPYDKIVSIEMLEAVGREWLATYFKQVDKLLKKDGGIACFQCITMPETVRNPVRSATSEQVSELTRQVEIRRLRQVGRLHPPLHLPWRPPPYRLTARLRGRHGLLARAHHVLHRRYWTSLCQDAAAVARELPRQLRKQNQTSACRAVDQQRQAERLRQRH
jgi:ubiquinone/menaquinone biosynthesis C-methylase UbiE